MDKLMLSYVHGPSDSPLIGETIGAHLDRVVERWGDRMALISRHQGVRWTYGELREKSREFAAGLLSLGFEPGDRLGIWAPNNAEWLVVQYAAAMAGIILVNINPAYRIAELEYVLRKVGCKGIVTAAKFKTSDYHAMLRQVTPELDTCAPGDLRAAYMPELRTVITLADAPVPGMLCYRDVAAMGTAAHRRRLGVIATGLQFDDPISIQFTSGTTGAPKGATLTHHNILNNAFSAGEVMRFTPDDLLCLPVPLYHCFGMVMGNLTCMTHGSAVVYASEAFDPLEVLKAVDAERCTVLHGVPTMFIAELEHPEFARFDLTSLRTGIMAGAPCPIEIMKRVIQDMHMHQVTIGYGMTETSPVSFQSRVDDPIERRVSTVGRIHPHLEVKIVDAEGRVVPRGVAGELLTRGYSVMRGYWDDPERTAEAIDAGRWMHTGDLATIDEEGYCNIVGRIKDMLIRGGENVYPREIEEYLFRHPKVQDVQVFGVPDPKYGEEICAWIILHEGDTSTPEDIQAFCKGQIAHYKIPRYIKFVDAFPMTVTGKAQKFVMRDRMIAELGLKVEKTA
jgi:fatty-acyl-CoA synthase